MLTKQIEITNVEAERLISRVFGKQDELKNPDFCKNFWRAIKDDTMATCPDTVIQSFKTLNLVQEGVESVKSASYRIWLTQMQKKCPCEIDLFENIKHQGGEKKLAIEYILEDGVAPEKLTLKADPEKPNQIFQSRVLYKSKSNFCDLKVAVLTIEKYDNFVKVVKEKMNEKVDTWEIATKNFKFIYTREDENNHGFVIKDKSEKIIVVHDITKVLKGPKEVEEWRSMLDTEECERRAKNMDLTYSDVTGQQGKANVSDEHGDLSAFDSFDDDEVSEEDEAKIDSEGEEEKVDSEEDKEEKVDSGGEEMEVPRTPDTIRQQRRRPISIVPTTSKSNKKIAIGTFMSVLTIMCAVLVDITTNRREEVVVCEDFEFRTGVRGSTLNDTVRACAENIVLKPGETCGVSCKLGFKDPYPGEDDVVTCSREHTKIASRKICFPETCLPTQVAHSDRSKHGSIYGKFKDTIRVNCDVGYVGGGETRCLSNRTFSRVQCDPLPCVPTHVANSVRYSEAGSLHGFTGDLIRVECNVNYCVKDNSTKDCVSYSSYAVCDPSGRFRTPVCEPVEPEVILNTHNETTNNQTNLEDLSYAQVCGLKAYYGIVYLFMAYKIWVCLDVLKSSVLYARGQVLKFGHTSHSIFLLSFVLVSEYVQYNYESELPVWLFLSFEFVLGYVRFSLSLSLSFVLFSIHLHSPPPPPQKNITVYVVDLRSILTRNSCGEMEP